MPAPYPLLDMPPGKYSDKFDYHAINMAAAHNIFIQGINAVVAHAPHITEGKIQPFMLFCLTLFESIHQHHITEETYYFPAMEAKLGEGTLSANIEEHATFVPKLEETESWLQDVQSGKETYDHLVLLDKVNSFADLMFDHLKHEVPTLESSKIRAVFSVKELKEIDDELNRRVFSEINFYTTVPMTTVCGNPATPWFPPLPTPMKWATRWWFSRRHREAWEFGPLDFYGNPRKLPDPIAVPAQKP